LIAAAVLVSATVLTAPAASAQEAVRVQANPPRVVLGKDKGADITVLIDAPGRVSDVRFETNVGRVKRVRAAGSKKWVAHLDPPEQFFPQAAIVVAIATVDGRDVAGWTVVPMWGQGALEVAGEPGSPLEVKIGPRTYGPIPAGPEGTASIPIEVAPGETSAQAGDQEVPLGAVDFPRMVGVTLMKRVEVRPDVDVRSGLLFFGIDQTGQPLDEAKLKLDAQRGTLSAARKLAPGTFGTTLRIPPRARPGEIKVRWRLTGAEASRGSIELDAVKAPPAVASTLDGWPDARDGVERDLLIEAPDEVVLGRDEQAELAVQLPPDMRPDDEMRFFTSVGTITNVRSEGSRVLATLLMPEEQYPQVAIIAAVVEAGGRPHVGVRPLPLSGQGNIRVKGKKNAEVKLKIGEREFGPAKTDRRGFAEVEAIVPPGYDHGTTDGGDRVELGVAPFPRILPVPMKPRLSANGRSEMAVRIFAFSPRGEPLAEAPVQLLVDRGEIAKPQSVAPGIFTVRYRAPTELGAASFVARLTRDQASVIPFSIPIVSPPPDRVEVTFNPREFVAGGAQPEVKVAVLDESGNPTSGAIDFVVDGAVVGEVIQVSRGRWETKLNIPDKLPGKLLNVVVKAEGVETSAQLPLLPADPERMVAKTKAESLMADGSESADVDVTVADKYGNPVEGAPVVAKAQKGQFVAVEEVGGGRYRAKYQSPVDYAGGPDTLDFSAGEGLVTQTTVDLRPSRKMLLIGAHAGFASNLIAMYAPEVVLDATLQGSGFLDGVQANLEVGGLYNLALTGQSDRQLIAVPVVATLGYRLRFGDASLFVGAGGEMDYVYSTVGSNTEQLLAWGAVGQLGGAYRLGPGEVVLKARYTYGGLQGAFGAGTILAGYAFEVF
jgi:hypothetical protein